uniref:Uncharacterized protein n=1 Tax=Arundo donax TaxID=35708 RepID=A0A0A9DYL9_ARUDO
MTSPSLAQILIQSHQHPEQICRNHVQEEILDIKPKSHHLESMSIGL